MGRLRFLIVAHLPSNPCLSLAAIYLNFLSRTLWFLLNFFSPLSFVLVVFNKVRWTRKKKVQESAGKKLRKFVMYFFLFK